MLQIIIYLISYVKNGVTNIQKDELIQLHMFLVQLKSNLEDNIINTKSNHFLSYESLNISPQQVFKSKKEQKLAIFELSRGIANLIKEKHPTAFQKLCKLLYETCNKLKK